MSVKNVKVFFEKVKGNEGLQKKLKALAEREKAIYADLVNIASAVPSCQYIAGPLSLELTTLLMALSIAPLPIGNPIPVLCYGNSSAADSS